MRQSEQSTEGRQVKLTGKGGDAKAGAVLITPEGETIYIRGLPMWPGHLLSESIDIVGTLTRRKLIPSAEIDDDGASSAGAEGLQWVLDGAADWKKGLGRVVVVTGTARNAGAGPVIATPIGPLYVHAAGQRWPESVEGKTVTGVGELLRKKRPSTPDNDDSIYGGKPELTEEWALDRPSWTVE